MKECPSCKGTGIYIGFGEHDGAGIVCSNCHGRSSVRAYTIKRVYLHNPGIFIGEKDGFKLEDFGGMSYQDWMLGKHFTVGTEMRAYSCPAWYYQGANYKLKPSWNKCICMGSFSECKFFSCKDECWHKWNNEVGRFLQGGVIESDKFLLLPSYNGDIVRGSAVRVFMPPNAPRSDEDENPVI